MTRPGDALILGCGYLGTFFLQHLQGRGVAVTRKIACHPALQRCDPASTWQSAGLAPVYPDYVSGLAGIVPAGGDAPVTPG